MVSPLCLIECRSTEVVAERQVSLGAEEEFDNRQATAPRRNAERRVERQVAISREESLM